MRRVVRGAVLAFGIAVAGAQLVPVERSNPPARGEPDAPQTVKAIFRRACYDCHSHETRWPWYCRVAPVSWLVAHDVNEGRGKLNFSTWESLAPDRRAHKMEEIGEETRDGKMPLGKYVLMHPEARLTPEEVRAIAAWAASAPQAKGAPPGYEEFD